MLEFLESYVYAHTQNEECKMRTNVVLDEKLVKEALQLSGIKTKRELIHQALIEFVKNKKRKNLLDLYGKIEFKKDYDYKSMRN